MLRNPREDSMSFVTPVWDESLFFLVNDAWRNAALDFTMPLVSNSLLLWGVVAVCFGVVIRRTGQWKPYLAGLVLILLVSGAGDATCNVLKKEFGRIRPYNAMAGVHFVEDSLWRQRPADFVTEKTRGNSYVSAHAANSMAAAGMAVLLWPHVRLLRLVLLLPLCIGYSRLYLGKHYPTDVLAGWCVGLAVVLVASVLLPERIRAYVRGGSGSGGCPDSACPADSGTV